MITNLNQFIDYIKLMMGNSVVNIEVSDEQFAQIAEDTIQTFQKYTYGDATYQDVLSINLSANVSAYQLPSGIDSVIDMDLSTSRGSLNDLFTVQRQMIVQQFQYGSMLGGNGYGTMGPRTLGGQNNLSEYNINMLTIKQIQDFFQKKYTCQYSSNTNTLRVWPTPEEDCVAMLTVWKKELAQDLYSNYHVKNLAVAKGFIMLGLNLGKYNIQLPGSSTINYQMYIDRGTALEEKTMENIRMETWLPTIGVG